MDLIKEDPACGVVMQLFISVNFLCSNEMLHGYYIRQYYLFSNEKYPTRFSIQRSLVQSPSEVPTKCLSLFVKVQPTLYRRTIMFHDREITKYILYCTLYLFQSDNTSEKRSIQPFQLTHSLLQLNNSTADIRKYHSDI